VPRTMRTFDTMMSSERSPSNFASAAPTAEALPSTTVQSKARKPAFSAAATFAAATSGGPDVPAMRRGRRWRSVPRRTLLG
jgi:hypothetical protein